METKRHRLVMTGRFTEERRKEQVAQQLGKLLGKSTGAMLELMKRSPCILKTDLSSDVAARYREVLQRIGVECRLEAYEVDASEPKPDAKLEAAIPPAKPLTLTELSLEPIAERPEDSPESEPPAKPQPVSRTEPFPVRRLNPKAARAKRPLWRRLWNVYGHVSDQLDNSRDAIGEWIPLKVWDVGIRLVLVIGILLLFIGGARLWPPKHEIVYQMVGPRIKPVILCQDTNEWHCKRAGYSLWLGNTGSEKVEKITVVFKAYPLRTHVDELSETGSLTAELYAEQQAQLKEEKDKIFDELLASQQANQSVPGYINKAALHQTAWQLARERIQYDPDEELIKEYGPLQPGKTLKIDIALGFAREDAPIHNKDLLVKVETPAGIAHEGDPHVSIFGRFLIRLAD